MTSLQITILKGVLKIMLKIDTVIPFCSYDNNFINYTIEGIREISNNIIITYFDRTFDNKPENLDIVEEAKKNNKDCKFIKLNFDISNNARWHHNYTRWIGYQLSKSDRILFLDSDEVFEKNKIKEWINQKDIIADVTTFANYWYFRSTRYRALTYEDSPMLVNRKVISEENIFSEFERSSYKYIPNLSKEFGVLGIDNKPMCHHYSWAMNKDEMLRKVNSWGHKGDKDWNKLIEEEFSRNFNGTDFIHGYKYEICETLIK